MFKWACRRGFGKGWEKARCGVADQLLFAEGSRLAGDPVQTRFNWVFSIIFSPLPLGPAPLRLCVPR